MPKKNVFLYGWFMIAIAWVCYGFGISPAYYSWGIFSDYLMEDLSLNATQFGAVFGVFTLLYSCVGFLVGPAMNRWSIRAVMTCGFITSAIGFFYMSRADSIIDCFIGFSILGGAGIGFATIIPCQTIGQNWFLKRRALAIALILIAGGIVGKGVARVDNWILAEYTWRTGWVVISCISAGLAVFAAIFVRDTPEQVGLGRDGATEEEEKATLSTMLKTKDGETQEEWTGSQAIRTPQFAMMVLCGVAYAVPWGVVVPHLKLHLLNIGYEGAVAATFVGTMALISIGGRLAGAIGDYVPAHLVLAFALLMEGLGTVGLLVAQETYIANISITLIALGFGTAYISVPVVFSHFFGRKAFGVTSGIRITITGVFNALGPIAAGFIFDQTGAYTIAFIGIGILCLIGSISAALLRHPGAPPQTATAEEAELAA